MKKKLLPKIKSNMTRELITPARAQEYLDHNKLNRKLRPGVVEKYAADILAGKWTECIVPIVFYENGDIADGQHRLWAIVETKIPVPFYVLRGLSHEAGLNIDTGLNRTIVDNAHISGSDSELSTSLVALAIFYEYGQRQTHGASHAVKLAIVNKNREPCKWALKHGPNGRGFRNAVIMGAMARAYAHGVEPERVAAFAKVLATGFAVNASEDSAAIALRNYMLAHNLGFGVQEHRDLFLKAMNALSYFAKGKPLNVIKPVRDEVYPLIAGATKIE